MISVWVVPGPNFKHVHKSKSKLVSISWGTIVNSGEQTISKKSRNMSSTQGRAVFLAPLGNDCSFMGTNGSLK